MAGANGPRHARPPLPIRQRPALRIALLSLASLIVASGAAFAGVVSAAEFASATHPRPATTRLP